jgi:ATP-dependent RNA helicase DeaD
MNKFEALGIDPRTAKAIQELGFESPTPIQEQTIPALLGGVKDLIALAQTGTGKTAAFGLPLVNQIDFENRHTQALILCPTRELCMQITRDLKSFTKYYAGAHIVPIYGGASIEMQSRDIQRGAQIIVATPGRMVDMLERGIINIKNISWVILDEADEMLNMGFQEDLDRILSDTPAEKSTWLFSATMPSEVLRISKRYMNDPFEITVGNRNEGAANIEHVCYIVHARDRYLALKRIVDFNPDIFGIIFCRTKMETQEVADHLIKDGYNADSLHGDLSQAQRDYVMKRYRGRTLQLLVATDVAARGIDVSNVTHVINYNLPDEIENYTHRSGRTARAGRAGVSIAIVNLKEAGKIRMIERIIGKKFIKGKVPTGFEVCERQLFHLVKKVHTVEVKETEIAAYLPAIYEELKDLSKEELIKRFISEEFNRFLNYYRNAPDLNVDGQSARMGESSSGGKRFFISIGTMDGLERDSLKEYISSVTNLTLEDIKQVDVKNSFSFFEVDKNNADTISAAFKKQFYRGRPVRIETSEGKSGPRGGGGRSSGSYGGGGGYGGGSQRPRTQRHSGFKRDDDGNKSDGYKSDGGNRSGGGYKSKPDYRPKSDRSEGEINTGSKRKDSFAREGRVRKRN